MEKFENLDCYIRNYSDAKDMLKRYAEQLDGAYNIYMSHREEVEMRANMLYKAIFDQFGENVIEQEIDPETSEEEPKIVPNVFTAVHCIICNKDYKNAKTFGKHCKSALHKSALNKGKKK